MLAATRAGIGICVLAQSRVPGDLRILSGRFDLPPLPDVEMALVDNPRSARGPVEALSRAMVNLPLGAARLPERTGPGADGASSRARGWGPAGDAARLAG